MKAITVRQPWAQLIVTGRKTIETRPRPTSYRGRVAIHAGKVTDPRFTQWWWADFDPNPEQDFVCDVFGCDIDQVPGTTIVQSSEDDWYRLAFPKALWPLGAVVGSAVLVGCVPMVADWVDIDCLKLNTDTGRWWRQHADHHPSEADAIDDQVPLGDFAPGRWGLILEDAKTCQERCPWCWGDQGARGQVVCSTCCDAGHCEPIPTRGQQSVPWNWSPA